MPPVPSRNLAPDKPGRSPANRSLERGVEILRSFRPGSELLGNAELAERTGLSKSTVSRLTQTLVGMGLLQLDACTRSYGLAAPVLSLAHAFRSGSTALGIAAPLMRKASQARQINVGMAAADRDEMVYLESIRYNRRPSLRTVVSGQRVPMALTSLGRAYLSTVEPARRELLLAHFQRERRSRWAQLKLDLQTSFRAVAEKGYCAAAWQPEVVALATPLSFRGVSYALNVSVSSDEALEQVERELAPVLMDLKRSIQMGLDNADDAFETASSR
ncbi:Transcriptional regulator, IclR family [Burkholderiales bacterium 8X]|nr:Transcriptional regulator, IclR family [Burkholderiales bacterium 8X]